ncbi:OTU domain-containing protein 4 isoform X2 [Colossoma macropomum]|uniref:OTU domain-containing protein 4 isoform X2 n=1 Tax=Colossoma macropomum TaxID=42526 RepID=UPI001864FCC0|nr:OTU domain-containing protein 4 isoform X2 [Colossoma macropomum]
MATRAANMQSNNADKGLDEKLMDEYLKANGLYRRKIAKDGSCLFRAVAEQVLRCQGLHTKVRAECVKYLRKNRELYESFIEGDFDEYLQRLQDPQSWVGQVEISALAVLYKHDFIIYQNPGEPPVNITENGYPDKVRLCFLNGNHYDSVYPVSFVKNAAMCQSILYELLYERVCGVDRSVVTASTKGSRARDEAADVEGFKGSEESDLDEGEDFWSSEATGKTTSVNNRPPYKGRGRGQSRGGGRGFLPRDAQESLNPGIFRNVEYDVWMRSKKAQQRRDFCMAAGMQYTAGDKCQVRLNNTGRYYSAYIQDVSPDDGPVTVFIEELGQKHTVPLWNLRTPSEESWCTVTEKGKKHSVTNGSGNTNGGRKPVRSVSIPYASQAAAGSAPSNRVQKQHSWPPQTPEEAQSQGKNAGTRKSEQDVGVLGVSPAEEEELLVLELLHKDENNFPSLEASAQVAAAAAVSEGGKRAERKGSRKKADMETKDPSQRPEQKADRGKHGKGPVVQDQRISPSIKEKPNSSPPSTPPSANSPAPSGPKATKAAPPPSAPAPASVSAQTTPARAQTASVPSTAPLLSTENIPGQSQTVSVASTTTSGSAQAVPARSQTAPVGSKTNASTQSQTASAQASASATAAPTPQNAPTQSQTAPSVTNSVSSPLSSALTPNPSHIASVPPAAPVSNPAPSPSAPVPTTTTVPSPLISQTTSVPLTTPTSKPSTTPLSTPTTLPTPAHSESDLVTTPALPETTSATSRGPEPNPVPSQSATATTPALVTTPAQVPTPTPSHITPTSSLSDTKVPVQTPPRPAEVPGASSTPPAPVSVSAHTLSEPAHAPHSITPPAPVNVSAATVPQFSSAHTPFHPIGLGTFPMIPHYPPYMTPAPTSAPMLAPSAAISSAPTPPYSHPSEPRPYEPAASPVAGVGPTAVPDCLPHGLVPHPQHPHPQHPFSLPPLSHPYQDPLYPGFPQNEKDEAVQTSTVYFSIQCTGKDLPKDPSILRFFFNLGVKAYNNQMIAPVSYLAPLTHAYQIQLKVPPPAPSSNPYTPPWQSDNPPSMLHMSSAPNHPHIGPPVGPGVGPVGHFEVRSVVPAPPPVEAGSYSAHPHSVPMHVPPQPGVPWSVAPRPNVYAGIYSAPHTGQYSAPPCPPQSGLAYPSPSVGHQRPPVPPPQHHGRDISMVTVAPAIERGEGDGQRSSTPQVEKPIWLAGGQPHSGSRDNKPAAVPVAMEPQRGSSASPVVQMVSFGSVAFEDAESTKLANGNKREDNLATSFQGGASVGLISHVQSGPTVDEWDLEEAEYGDADLRSGRSYYSRSFRAGGRRGQEGGGFRGRNSRARRDYGGRGRATVNQPYYQTGYMRGRGRGYVQHSNAREAGYAGGQFTPAAET